MEQFSFQNISVLGWLLESTIYISILICMIFIIKAFMKSKLPAWWNYCLWLLLLVRMLIPFGVETPVSVYNYVPAPPENSSYMPYLVQNSILIPFYENAPDASPITVPSDTDLADKSLIEAHDISKSEATDTSGFSLSLDRALLLFWITGVLAFGIVTIYKNCKFWLIVRREKPVTDKNILDLFDECRSALGTRKKMEIIVTDSVKSPAIFGYIKPQLLLPPQFLETLKKDELECVFLHELGHMKRHDIGISWLVTFFQITYWFNPLVWYAFHHLRADQETACDAYVLSKIKQVRPTDYARTIVNLLERFVQNRQLPSLAGIIENRSQIDRRISMILDYKRITLKTTLVSVLMLFLVACVFFSCSNEGLSDRGSSLANITQPENSDMKHYKNDDWYFSLNIPNHWSTSTYLPAYLADKGQLASFGSNDDGLEALRIFMFQYDPELSLDEERDRFEKQLTDDGYGNFISTETTIGSRKALILDYDKRVEDGTLRAHTYLVPYKSIIYVLNFATARPDASFEFYDQIAKTFEIHKAPVAHGIKKYVSLDGDTSLDIPAHWKTLPPIKKYDQLIRFGTLENGLTAIIYNPAYSPWETLEDFRTWIQGIGAESGWKNFTNSETVIGEDRKALISDSNNGSIGARDYFFKEGDYKYWVAFFASPKNWKPSDRLEVYEPIMKSIVIHKNPEVAGFKEYVGSDLEKPIASGTKRYISPDDDYTIDVPGNWHSYAKDNKAYLFGASEIGLAAVFYPRWYSPQLALDEIRDNQVKINSDAGWKILDKSETVINERKVLMLDSNQGATNIRNYFFKEGNYIYSVLFYASNTEGIPADMIEGYEQVMKSISIINAGQDLDKTTYSGIERAEALSVEFRFCENQPDIDLEGMMVSGSDRKLYLHKESVLSNADIMTAIAQKIETGFGVSVTFTEAGGKKFAEITKNNVGKVLGIVLDGKLIMAPVINASITGGRAQIQGNFTLEEAKRIARGIVGGK